MQDRQNACNIGVGWHDDFIAGTHLPQSDITFKDQRQGIKPVGYPDAVLGATVLRKITFKFGHLIAQNKPGTFERLPELFVKGGFKRFIYGF